MKTVAVFTDLSPAYQRSTRIPGAPPQSFLEELAVFCRALLIADEKQKKVLEKFPFTNY